MPAFIDRTGERHGRWLIVSYVGAQKWACMCDCGAQHTRKTGGIVSGTSTSCGCTKERHGQTQTLAYGRWALMWQRCTNPNHKGYKNYGGRGITVCERWDSFKNFYADMGEAPEGRSLDRINNDGNYEPSNCRWATRKEQAQNSRNTKLSDADVAAIRGDRRLSKIIAAEYGLNPGYIRGVRSGLERTLDANE